MNSVTVFFIVLSIILLVILVSYVCKQRQNEKLHKEYAQKEEDLKQHYSDLEAKLDDDLRNQQRCKADQFANTMSEFDRLIQEKQLNAEETIQLILGELKFYEDLKKAIVAENVNQAKIKDELNFYRICLTDVEKSDIVKLRTVALQLSKPVILYKLIYEVYYKPKLDETFKRILSQVDGDGGIYRITNILDNKVYIGRTTNFLSRWRDHAKCGTGADKGTQINTRLYEAMLSDGIENFTFEVVDVCDKEAQPEREKYWISFCKSNEFGYNIQAGG